MLYLLHELDYGNHAFFLNHIHRQQVFAHNQRSVPNRQFFLRIEWNCIPEIMPHKYSTVTVKLGTIFWKKSA